MTLIMKEPSCEDQLKKLQARVDELETERQTSAPWGQWVLIKAQNAQLLEALKAALEIIKIENGPDPNGGLWWPTISKCEAALRAARGRSE